MTASAIPVLAAPHVFNPAAGRVDFEMPEGSRIADIVARALPGMTDADLGMVRVILVSRTGRAVIERAAWHGVRPKAGVQVVIRVLPGKSALRSILSIVVAIAAVALGQLWAPALAGAFGISTGLASGLIGLGVTLAGNLLINALVPPAKTSTDTTKKNTYTISGWRNTIDPDGVIPDVLGKVRFAPPFAAAQYSEIVNDEQYVIAVFLGGYGPVTWSEDRIGDTAITEYKNVEIETRDGLPGDAPLTLYPRTVIEDSTAADLTRPLPRDDAGNVISGAATETPVTRYTAADAHTVNLIFSFPAGLVRVDSDGDTQDLSVSIRIRYRQVGWSTWNGAGTIAVTAAKREGFYRQFTLVLPSRGRYEIQVTRMTDERTSTQISDRSVLVAMQSIRPEYPFNFEHPVALKAVRIKATYQLNGALDNFNSIVSRRCLDYDRTTGNWIERETSNPAALFRYVLQSPANPFPVPDSEIDLDNLAIEHDWMRYKGLAYNRVHDFDASLGEVMRAIAGAGRSSPRHDGLKYGLVTDRVTNITVDHFSPRNAEQIKWSRTYFDPPHAFRVRFNDETNDWKPAERVIRWPGYSGDVTISEEIELPGKTSPTEIYREARRRMYELIHRPDRYQLITDGAARAATRGDQVWASLDVISRVQRAARVVEIRQALVILDDYIEMVAGVDYCIRFRRYSNSDPDDRVGSTFVRQVITRPGRRRGVQLMATDYLPYIDSVVQFGPMGSEAMLLRIAAVEAGDNMSSFYHMVDAAQSIDATLDAEEIPAWSGRVGAEAEIVASVPAAPRFVAVKSGLKTTGTENGLRVTVAAESGAPVQFFRIDTKLSTATEWNTVTVPVANAGASITTYAIGDLVKIVAYAIGYDGGVSEPTVELTVKIGTEAADVAALDGDMIVVTGGLGSAQVTFTTTADEATKFVQVYRTTTATAPPAASSKIGSPIEVTPSYTYNYLDGDGTRSNIVVNSGFDVAANWTLGAGWSIASGVAEHVTQASGAAIGQAIAITEGKTYRIAYDIPVLTAGALQARISGGTLVNGGLVSASGSRLDRLTTVTGNTTLEIYGGAAFAGSVDNVVAFMETAQCAPQGTAYYWLQPLNADGIGGPITGPISARII